MIEHDIEIVLALSHTVAVLYHGRLLAEGSPGEIEKNRDVQKCVPRWISLMLLLVNDLNTHYGQSHVVQNVSFVVDCGELVCLLAEMGRERQQFCVL